MNPAQLLLFGKIGAVGVFVVGLYLTGHHMGAKAVQADWDRDKGQRIAMQDKLIAENDQRIMLLQQRFNETNVQVSTDHEQALQAIGKKYEADLAATRVTGGLRIPRTVCSASATDAKAAGDSGHNETTSPTVALPDAITSDLFRLAHEADELTEQARACQGWLRQNGFYDIQ